MALTVFLPHLFLVACATNDTTDPNKPPFRVGVTESVSWSPDGLPEELRADIHYPKTDTERPGVLVVHGGGWDSRSRADMSDTADELARQGFVVMNIDHRFAPAYRFPAQLQDVQLAMRWFRDNADKYRVGRERIGAWGFSSGAHLVSMLAVVSGGDSPLNEPWGCAKLAPKAVGAGGLPADFQRFEDGRRLRQLLGGPQDELSEAYREASPITHVHSGAPPFFLFHGTWDRLVPIEHAEAFAGALEENDVEVQFYRLWLRGHVLSFLFNGAATREAIIFLEKELGAETEVNS